MEKQIGTEISAESGTVALRNLAVWLFVLLEFQEACGEFGNAGVEVI